MARLCRIGRFTMDVHDTASGRDAAIQQRLHRRPLVEPGAGVVFLLDAALYRMPDGHLRLRGNRSSNAWVMLEVVEPGRYKIRVSYQNAADQFKTDGDGTVLKDVWAGDVPTPFVEVTVVGTPAGRRQR